MKKRKLKVIQYFVFIIGIISGIASILSFLLSDSIFPKLTPFKDEILFITILIVPLLFIIQLLLDKDIFYFYNILRNFIIRKLYIKKIKYNEFRTKIIEDRSIFCLSDESIKKAYYNGKVYITLKPRMTVNSVQLSLFSKLKEITSYGIKAVIFINDFDSEEEEVRFYKNVLKKFLSKRPYVIYRISNMAKDDFSRVFKQKFEKDSKDIKICWLLNRSAELLKTSFCDNGKLKFDIYHDDNTTKSNSIIFNRKEVYTSDILFPIFEIINMQILLDKNGNNHHHYFVLSGINMQEFWMETKEQLKHNFSALLMPLIKNLTNTNYAMTGDDESCISLTKEKNDNLFLKISNIDSLLEHYKLILFKNKDIIGIQHQKERVLCFDNCYHFGSYEDLKKHINKNFNSMEEKKEFLVTNFKNHLNKLIDYVE